MLRKSGENPELVSVDLEEKSQDDQDTSMAIQLLPKENENGSQRNSVLQFLVSHSARVFGGVRLISQTSYTASGVYQPGGIVLNPQRLVGGVISLVGTSFILAKKEQEGSGTDAIPVELSLNVVYRDSKWDIPRFVIQCAIKLIPEIYRKRYELACYFGDMTKRIVMPHKYPRSFFGLCELATSVLYLISGINTGRSVEVASSISNFAAILLITYTADTDIAWTRYNLYRSITGIPVQVPNAIQSYSFGDYLSFFAIILGLTNFLMGSCLNGTKVMDKLPGRPFKEKCMMILTGKVPKSQVTIDLDSSTLDATVEEEKGSESHVRS